MFFRNFRCGVLRCSVFVFSWDFFWLSQTTKKTATFMLIWNLFRKGSVSENQIAQIGAIERLSRPRYEHMARRSFRKRVSRHVLNEDGEVLDVKTL